MVKLNKIYTRTGDDGTTGLGNGERRDKFDTRVEAYGTVDEANACIGIAMLQLPAGDPLRGELLSIQNDLFDLGADLATPDEGKDLGYEPLRITQKQVDHIEALIDRYNAALTPLNSFVLPGGSPLAAYLHLARTVVRRAERAMVELSRTEKVSVQAIRYANRLSDLLFVVSRVANDGGKADILWVPGKSR
ncbi:MAG TPA: cob(I)yrinic acid a,c-diamide adenosyltransferase [Rhizobiaceae bacterium]|nr:cob(I)yrinic acid a,c-diamide adenosyltransferase [Rhizobiaceae bacterium]